MVNEIVKGDVQFGAWEPMREAYARFRTPLATESSALVLDQSPSYVLQKSKGAVSKWFAAIG